MIGYEIKKFHKDRIIGITIYRSYCVVELNIAFWTGSIIFYYYYAIPR